MSRTDDKLQSESGSVLFNLVETWWMMSAGVEDARILSESYGETSFDFEVIDLSSCGDDSRTIFLKVSEDGREVVVLQTHPRVQTRSPSEGMRASREAYERLQSAASRS